MATTAADIKKLRETTGAGMLDCKKALDESGGDLAAAQEFLRVKGLKGVTKREGRTASNGLVTAHVDGGTGTLVEVNCETDFVAKGERFGELAQRVLDQAVAVGAADAEQLLSSDLDGKTVQQVLDEANASLGEKIEVRRVARLEGDQVVSYLHRTSPDLPPQIGAIVAVSGERAAEVGRDVAMHAAAMSPTFLSRDEVSEEVVANERRLAEETAREEGRPEQAMPKIVEGRVNGYFKDNVLLEQAFAKEAKKTVGTYAKEAGVEITGFARFRVGATA
ncbi:translation elongation factor Ts [Pseudokineococcus marinus]|uniref:Elongation factor Ts n=1 Tax=Pseudokineococcus marinus TaxID=351215 RepID=A0A849BY37_9ACTN|nr:translation elongation factor Ts [Pseudokineococcus marinus]NNH22438.1 elongation factor Ts [Pseudokineococcus marinus]